MKFINQSNEPPPLHLPLGLGDKRGENDTISDERISDSFFQIKSAVVAFYLFSRAILFTRTLFLANLIFLSFRSTTNDAPEPRPARCRFFARNETTLAGIKTYEYLTDRAVLNLSYACTLPEEKLLLTGPGGLASENSLGFFCSRPRFFLDTANKGHDRNATSVSHWERSSRCSSLADRGGRKRGGRKEDKNSERRPTFSNSGVLDNEVINRDANYREGIHHGGCGGKIMNR